MTYRLGIIGAGGIGTVHAEAAARAGVTVNAICDADRARASALAAAHGTMNVYQSPTAMFDAGLVDAVVIAVPNDLHVPVAIESLSAGVDVMLEKPMSTSLDHCDPLMAAVAASANRLHMNFVTRQTRAAHAAIDLVREGTLGDVYHVSARMIRQRGIPGLGRWFTSRDRAGGGVLIDIGIHLIDLIMHLIGRPAAQRASASCRTVFGQDATGYVFDEMWAGPPDPRGVCDVEDDAMGMVSFERGMTADLHVAWASNVAPDIVRDGVLLFGSRRSCAINAWTGSVEVMEPSGSTVVRRTLPLDSVDAWDEAWTRQHEHFARIVAREVVPDAPASHGYAAQAIVEAMYRSHAASGMTIDVQRPRA